MSLQNKSVLELQRKIIELEKNYRNVDMALKILFKDFYERKKLDSKEEKTRTKKSKKKSTIKEVKIPVKKTKKKTPTKKKN